MKISNKLRSHFNAVKKTKVITDTGWQVLDKIVRLATASFALILMVRYLHPEEYGEYNYALAFISFFDIVSTLGANQILTRDIVKEPENEEEIVTTALVLRVFSGLLLAAVANYVSGVFVKDAAIRLLIFVFSLKTAFRAAEPIELFFQSKLEYKCITYSKVISYLLSFVLLFAVIHSKQSVVFIALIPAVEIFVSSLGLIFVYLRGRKICFPQISLLRMRKVLTDSWPLIFSGIAVTLYMRIDQIMIGHMSGNSELGLYSSAVRLTEVFYVFPIAFIQSNFPNIVRLKESDETEFYNSLQTLYNRVSFMGYVFAILVTIFSKNIVTILYGESYIEASPILSLLIWSVLFVALGVARSSFLITMNWNISYLKIVTMASVLNIILNFMLIPKNGAFGAAVATVISYWFAVHGSCFLFRPLFRTGRMLTKSLILIR
ncbi:MAG: flippase [Phormidesmis sp.]